MSQTQDTIVAALMEQLIAEGPDGMAQVFTTLFNLAMRLERERFLGAGLYERNPDRRGYANGYKSKTLDTTAGTVTVDVPKAAGIDEPFYPRSLERGRRSSRAVMLAIAEMYVQGVSTRDAAKVMAEFGLKSLSSTQGGVSGISCMGHDDGNRRHRMARRKQPHIPDQLLDQLLAGTDAKAAFAKDGLLDELKKALAERVLNAEIDHHLEAGEDDGRTNSRNGYGKKRVLTDTGRMDLEVPRDRLSTFDPQLIAKYQRRFPGFDEKIISMYARGMSTREIQSHLRDLYGIDVSPDLISAVTDAVLEEVTEWQNRPLEALYPLIFFDAIRIKVRDEGTVRNKAVYVVLGVRPDGTKEILGLWIEQTEGAKFWLRVMNDLRSRGVEDVLIAIVDGLKGFPEAITTAFPRAQVQTCIVHLIRYSLAFVSYKDRKAVAAALKEIYKAKDADAGQAALEDFAEGPWGTKYPAIAQSWRRNWSHVIPFFAFPRDVPPDHLHHKFYRKLECQAAPGSQNEGTLSDRRERAQTVIPSVEFGRQRMEDAA